MDKKKGIDDIFGGLGDIFGKGDNPLDFLGDMFGNVKKDESEISVRKQLVQREKRSYDKYMSENPSVKERYDRAIEKSTGTGMMDRVLPIKDLPFDLPFEMPKHNDDFGSEYMISEKDAERMESVYKGSWQFIGMLNPEAKELMKGIESTLEKSKEYARKRDEIVEYVKDRVLISSDSNPPIETYFEDAVRSVIPTKEEYIEFATHEGHGDMFLDMLDGMGEYGEMKDVIGGVLDLRDLKATIKSSIAEKDADHIYG